MAAKKNSKRLTPTQPETPSSNASQEETVSPKRRAELCHARIEEVLRQYNCHIVPTFTQPELVGSFGNKLLLTATYGIFPKGDT